MLLKHRNAGRWIGGWTGGKADAGRLKGAAASIGVEADGSKRDRPNDAVFLQSDNTMIMRADRKQRKLQKIFFATA